MNTKWWEKCKNMYGFHHETTHISIDKTGPLNPEMNYINFPGSIDSPVPGTQKQPASTRWAPSHRSHWIPVAGGTQAELTFRSEMNIYWQPALCNVLNIYYLIWSSKWLYNWKQGLRYLYTHLRSSIFHNSQNAEATKCQSTDEWINKMWYVHKVEVDVIQP